MEHSPHEDSTDNETVTSGYKMTAEEFERFRADVAKKIQLADQRSQPEAQRSTTRYLQRYSRKFGSRALRLNHTGRSY